MSNFITLNAGLSLSNALSRDMDHGKVNWMAASYPYVIQDPQPQYTNAFSRQSHTRCFCPDRWPTRSCLWPPISSPYRSWYLHRLFHYKWVLPFVRELYRSPGLVRYWRRDLYAKRRRYLGTDGTISRSSKYLDWCVRSLATTWRCYWRSSSRWLCGFRIDMELDRVV